MRLENLNRGTAGGFALIMVMFLLSIGFLALGGALLWTANNTTISARNTNYYSTQAAAEAATEKVLASIVRDFVEGEFARVDSRMETYRTLTPTTTENPGWSAVQFRDSQGALNRVTVSKLTNKQFTSLQSKFTGLAGYAANYRVTSRAAATGSGTQGSAATVQQDFQLASIPIFGFGVFYVPDLEICPGSAITLSGRVHGNGSVYLEPSVSLTLKGHVTSAKTIVHDGHPNDPLVRPLGTVVYQGEYDQGGNSFYLPIGTNNSPAMLRKLIEIPPSGESTTSALGSNRYYYRADLIILVSNDVGIAKSGAYNNFATTIPWDKIGEKVVKAGKKGKTVTTGADNFISTNVSFFNKRENKTIKATELDIDQLIIKSEYLRSVLGRYPKTIYIADLRTQTSTTEAGIILVNGDLLPQYGLTIATSNPLYIQGHFNAPTEDLGTTNTTRTKPAALAADAITVLSGNWTHANSSYPLPYRIATSTTVNAALITGIVASGGGYYSGGVENCMRLLEDWTGHTLTYNGSFCVLFYSQTATAPWGATADIYNVPIRRFAFDQNFLEAAKIPASTPEFRAIVRGQWTVH